MIIPLIGGAVNAHPLFSVQLGDNLVEFELNYIQTGQWVVNLSQEGVIIAAGLMLEPNADITRNYNLNIGQLVFIGDDTTLDNLGVDNRLVWIEP